MKPLIMWMGCYSMFIGHIDISDCYSMFIGHIDISDCYSVFIGHIVYYTIKSSVVMACLYNFSKTSDGILESSPAGSFCLILIPICLAHMFRNLFQLSASYLTERTITKDWKLIP